jgi:hypothetical protein
LNHLEGQMSSQPDVAILTGEVLSAERGRHAAHRRAA